MLNRKTKYAIKAILALARRREDGFVLIADLAESERIPRKFLEQILLELRKAGILASSKGKGGGYMLGRQATEISLGSIIRIIEGPLALVPCVSQQSPGPCDECPDPMVCGLRPVMKVVRDQTAELLDKTSIASILEKERDLHMSKKTAIDFVI
jgi:Rrf2 family protein